ncbi:MAG: helicase-related protein, partial [Gammaproteobacteria bacterium]|nr:helicase-related protein [Gammaproteobacteria bacterium]
LGQFDVLVGINLLREGLDIPEVSLVAIFDADKEGFLRSERSLIQTIGRAARNLNGKAILYADNITGSMQRAIDESSRRRNTQLEFNASHNITPIGVKTKVLDVMEGAYSAPGTRTRQRGRAIAEKTGAYGRLEFTDPTAMQKEIGRLEEEMYDHARNLAFEAAAATRDRIAELKNQLLKQ